MQRQIYKNTFKNCRSLTKLQFPVSVLSIGDYACQGCTSLADVQMGSNLKFIGTSAFCGDAALSSVSRLNGDNVMDSRGNPNTFDIVGNYAFAETGLARADLALRSSAIQTFWGDGCFQDCKRLEYVHFLSANYMSRNMFKGCTSLVSADYDVPMMAYTYPGIFDGCTGLKEIKNLPAQLLFIPEGTFSGCSRLQRVEFNTYGLNSSVDEVQKNAYFGTRLTELQFPQSIDSLDELDPECLSGATRLDTVKFHGIGSDQISVQTSQGVSMVDAVLSSGFFGLRHDVNIWCKDMPDGQYMRYRHDEKKYRPPTRVEYSSDKTTTANFQTGKWYYSAQNVYEDARRRNIPCLFIYSLWGCGPCAVYQKKLWNNEEFQDWFEKQKFLLCGLECEQQPMYDRHLQFLVDNVQVNAENFASANTKDDMWRALALKPPNALGQKFGKYKVGESSATTLMTPVLIFMDEDGKCWDYSYHNLATDIRRFNVKGMIQRLKSLCLYHFDGNTLDNAKYVIDAGKTFNAADYATPVDNPWQVGSNVMNMSISIHTEDYDYEAVMTPEQLEQSIVSILMTVPNYASVMAGNKHPYIAGCLFGSIDWVSPMFPDIDIEKYTEASQLNAAFSRWYFKIGDLYYKMTFSANDKEQIENPCDIGMMEWIFRASFSPVSYPG